MSEEKTEGQGGEQKLIAGRYKSVEEAEKALEEKERMIGRLGDEVGQLRKRVEETAQVGSPRSGGDEGDLDEEAISQEMFKAPGKFLRDFGQGLVHRTLAVVAEQTRREIDIALTVDRFVQKNPLAEKHSRLFRAYLAHTDAKKPVLERLNDALGLLKADLTQAATEQADRKLAERQAREKASTVEGGGESEVEEKPSEEPGGETAEFDAYLAERSAARAKRVL